VLKCFHALALSLATLAACSSADNRHVSEDFPVPDGRCENRAPRDFLSLDRRYKAVQFSRRCGSELPSLNISVLPVDATLPDEPGNVLVDVPPNSIGGYRTHVSMLWFEEHTLTIERNESMTLEKSVASAGEVQVFHKVVPDAA
jgi:hypothetical protein